MPPRRRRVAPAPSQTGYQRLVSIHVLIWGSGALREREREREKGRAHPERHAVIADHMISASTREHRKRDALPPQGLEERGKALVALDVLQREAILHGFEGPIEPCDVNLRDLRLGVEQPQCAVKRVPRGAADGLFEGLSR